MLRKFFCLIVCGCLILTLSSGVFCFTDVINGTMSSSVDGDQRYVLNIQDLGGGIAWIKLWNCNYPDYALNPLTQDIQNFNRAYSRAPNDIQDNQVDADGNNYCVIKWDNPPVGSITTTCTFTANLNNVLNGLEDQDTPFPPTGTLPTRYLEATEYTQSDSQAIIDQAQAVTDNDSLEYQAVIHIMDWIIDNITYGSGPSDALSVLHTRKGTCQGYAHLAVAMMKAVGIPARFVGGGSIHHAYTIPGPSGPIGINWGQGTHAWIEVYYPHADWIPYDPQLFYHYQHTHAYKGGIGRDRKDVSDAKWQYAYYPPEPNPKPTLTVQVNSTVINDNINFSYLDTLHTPNHLAVADSTVEIGVNLSEMMGKMPRAFFLSQNYPNPFNPITEIKYALPKDCWVRLEVYNILGQRVASLVDGEQKAGYKTVRWDARDTASGIYFYRLQASDFVQARKMVLIR